MALFPHERSLVKKYADKPFALVGVNSDTDKKRIPERMKRFELTWRSFWNGPKGPYGPISKEWNVPTWPWVVVLDGDGVVRHQAANDKGLIEVIDGLLAELENKG